MALRLTAMTTVLLLATGCASSMSKRTLSSLHRVEPDMADVHVDSGIEQALLGYRKFLEESPTSELTPVAMRRLADLQLAHAVHGRDPSNTGPGPGLLDDGPKRLFGHGLVGVVTHAPHRPPVVVVPHRAQKQEDGPVLLGTHGPEGVVGRHGPVHHGDGHRLTHRRPAE